MLNYIWAGMIIIGVTYGAIQGNLLAISSGILESAKEAVKLSITMLGILSFWMGMMEIATQSGMLKAAAKKCAPLIGHLFPDIPRDHPAFVSITTNLVANFFGLGWAATPAGLRAMQDLKKLSKSRGENMLRASDEMCTFLVLNISSVQLIPINIIAYRSQYGSNSPTAIIGGAIIATTCSTLMGIAASKFFIKYRKLHGHFEKKCL